MEALGKAHHCIMVTVEMVKFFLACAAFFAVVVLVGILLGMTLLWDWEETRKPGKLLDEDDEEK